MSGARPREGTRVQADWLVNTGVAHVNSSGTPSFFQASHSRKSSVVCEVAGPETGERGAGTPTEKCMEYGNGVHVFDPKQGCGARGR